jgi:hypothetical protein
MSGLYWRNQIGRLLNFWVMVHSEDHRAVRCDLGAGDAMLHEEFALQQREVVAPHLLEPSRDARMVRLSFWPVAPAAGELVHVAQLLGRNLQPVGVLTEVSVASTRMEPSSLW